MVAKSVQSFIFVHPPANCKDVNKTLILQCQSTDCSVRLIHIIHPLLITIMKTLLVSMLMAVSAITANADASWPVSANVTPSWPDALQS